jgi:hypothetical protein
MMIYRLNVERAKGGYTVQPVPTPSSTIDDRHKSEKILVKASSLNYLIEERPYQVHL